ncbi:MAG: hypothetical protein DRN00_03515, partial [Thermoplasmata archaeon]
MGCTMGKKIKKGKLCRVRNRIDLIGEVVKIENKFVRIKIPHFKGHLEYPMDLVEEIEDDSFLGEVSGFKSKHYDAYK